ncbi:flap endonuclease 1-like isoform X3 [Camellia sinensis]|uniref:flap endonuclease 1-like isoform X3 n=1 Tax=Camellia sinensis TaxID=4442 RepID=UPI0010365B26|nr:flap endonuclease 1-like isoform X3 [Camellia sinensis]
MLTNVSGEVTSHLQGMFTRTIRLLEAGLKPVHSKRADATEDLNKALVTGNKEQIEKFSKRTVKVGFCRVLPSTICNVFFL